MCGRLLWFFVLEFARKWRFGQCKEGCELMAIDE
jgi:hypothetical protein